MNLLTLIRFLCFDRRAVDQIASCRSAVWVGLGFVLLAPFARDYDGVDLLSKPIHLLVPMLASLFTATLIFGYLCLFRPSGRQPLTYRQFLAFFWLTGPLVWLYAFPVERLLSARDAAVANLWLLAVVSLWRVLLISRVISLRNETSFFVSMIRVLMVADTIVLVVLLLTPLPVFNIMGGVRLSPRDKLILGTAINVGVGATILWPILLINNIFSSRGFAKVSDGSDRPGEALTGAVDVPSTSPDELRAGNAGWTLWLSIVLLAGFSAYLLSIGQPQQQRRTIAEDLLRSNQIEEGLQYMSQFDRSDFPRHWNPPPAVSWREMTPHPVEEAASVLKGDYKPWVREACLNNFMDYFGFDDWSLIQWSRLNDSQLQAALEVIEHAAELDPEFVAANKQKLLHLEEHSSDPRAKIIAEFIRRTDPESPLE
ncbi:MAG: hypothetical protein KDA91_04455 [Planctomycetaceae bacterium]|nr:hypothetical protein [Planctomycetaceae bacterium]